MKRAQLLFRRNKLAVIIGIAIFATVGTASLLLSSATGLTIDTTLPVPKNVKAYGDDRNIIVTWEGSNDSRVVGYYLTYRRAGSSDAWTVKQSEARKTAFSERPSAIQIQPVVNGQEYEIYVQSAAGSYVTYPGGPLVSGSGNTGSTFAVANGNVSNKAAIVKSTPVSTRVDAMRQKYTGFFDDFNLPAGPFDELKWNQATNNCVAPNTGAAFINPQFHSHNMLKTGGAANCDRAGFASRPRATFDTTGASEQNPAELAMDIDGIHHNRDTWYLDLIPNSSHSTGQPIDITSHNDIQDQDTHGPGNMIRINARSTAFTVAYYDRNHISSELNLYAEGTACGQSNQGPTVLRYQDCNWSNKTAGISPIPEPAISAIPIPNVRRHWVIRITDSKMKIYIDSVHLATLNLPAEFNAEKKYTAHSTIFSYNTGKETRSGVIPYAQLIHWDNFGFTGPAPTEVVHNYLEGGATGTKPVYSTGSYETTLPTGNRTTIIPVPDDIGSIKDSKALFRFTVQPLGFYRYNWSPNDYIVFNGKRYNVPSPVQNSGDPVQTNSLNRDSYSFIMPIDKVDVKKGNNTVQFVMNGDPNGYRNNAADTFNVHLELPYNVSDTSIPTYTPPLKVFGDTFLKIVQPPITNCDQYRSIEQDLGLPYEPGKANLVIGECTLIEGHATIGDGSIHTPPPPSLTNQPPSSSLSTSVTGATAPATYSIVGSGSDSDGTITKIEIKQGSDIVKTCNSNTCTYNASNVSAGSYVYTSIATDDDGAITTSQTRTVTVSAPTPAPTSNKFTTLAVNANLPSELECASRVKPAIEVRPANQVPNSTKGTGGNYNNSRVSGNYTGTTDEIIQWGACKWGMDEDILRAQMVQESFWHQSAIGDFTSGGANLCSPVYPVANYPAQYNGDSTHDNQCPESYGLSQVRWTYHKSAFYISTDETTANLTNNAIYSTAYNVDYWASVWRRCYNGELTWLNTVEKGREYTAGDEWGCLGMWFSGRWYTSPATTYIANVQDNLNNRVWETTAFKNAQPTNTIPGAGTTTPSDTTAPTVSLTAPTNNTTVSGTVTISANASDNVGVTRVSYYLDGSSTAFSNDSTAPYDSTWNSANVPNGSHTITATAIDAAGNVGTSSIITINVQNIIPDTTAPSTLITAPTNNDTVNYNIVVAADATDNVGVTKVELVIDGIVAATDTTSPYSFNLDTTILSEGAHELRSRAYDAAGNNTYSDIVAVTVDNIPPVLLVCEDTAANNLGQELPCTYDPTPEEPPTPTTPGDANGDNLVNRDDLRIVKYYYKQSVPAYTNGDLDGNGFVDRDDYRIVLYYYSKK